MTTQQSVKAGQAFISLFADDSALIQGLQAAKEKIGGFLFGTSRVFKTFGSTLTGYGAGLIKFGSGAAVAVATSLASLGVGLKTLFGMGKLKKESAGKSTQADLSKALKESFSHIEFDSIKRTYFDTGMSAQQTKHAVLGGGGGGGVNNPNNLPVPHGAAPPAGNGRNAEASVTESLNARATGYTEEMVRFRKTTKASTKETANLGKGIENNTKRMSLLRMMGQGVGQSIKGISFVMSACSNVVRGVSSVIGGLFNDVKKIFAGIGKEVDFLSRKLKAWGLTFVGAATAILGVFGKASQDFANIGDGLDKMSIRTGASVEFLSEMGYAAKMSGSDISQVESALQGIRDKVMSGSDDIKMLNIDPRAMRFQSAEQQFDTLVKALGRVRDAQRQATLGSSIFGASLLPLLRSGPAGIAKLREEARRLGVSMDGEQVTAAVKLTSAWTSMMETFHGVKNMIGNALAPLLTELFNRVTPILANVGQWIKDNKQLIVTIAKLAIGAAAVGAALTAFGFGGTFLATVLSGLAGVLGMIGTAISAVGTVLGFLLSPIGLVSAAVVGLAGYFLYSSGLMGGAIDWLKEQFGALYSFVSETFQGICDAIMAGDLGLAFEVATAAVRLVWLKTTNWLLDKWYTVKYGMQEAWANTTFWLSSMFVEAVAAILKGWKTGISGLKTSWTVFSGWFETMTNNIKGWWNELSPEEIAAQNAAVAARVVNDVFNSQAELDPQLAQIDTAKKVTLAVLESNHKRDGQKRTTAYAKALTEMEQAETDARNKSKAAAEKAGIKRREFEESQERGKAKQAKIAQGTMPISIPAIGGSTGTFSAFEMSGLGGNISIQQLEVTKQIRDKMDEQAVVR